MYTDPEGVEGPLSGLNRGFKTAAAARTTRGRHPANIQRSRSLVDRMLNVERLLMHVDDALSQPVHGTDKARH